MSTCKYLKSATVAEAQQFCETDSSTVAEQGVSSSGTGGGGGGGGVDGYAATSMTTRQRATR